MTIQLNIKSLLGKFKANTALVFYLILAAVIVFELFIVYGTATQILASRREPQGLAPSKGVRLQFNEYKQAADRIQAGRKFYPSPPIFENPFGTN